MAVKALAAPLAAAVAALAACILPLQAQAAPSTFSPVIGSALLCRSHLDNAHFHSYLTSAFGPSYKHEGGAYWFKASGTLWGTPVSDILVSDDTSELVFVGAVAETTPDKLEQAIRGAAGVRHKPADSSAFPVRQSVPGSKIVYFNDKSKIYCARYKPLPAAR
ncbi:hypothetical protein [Massilia cavernae]|uniref:Lipoprotein n=1 Tax=Massilia cavernae TaxID=2320864 RepID=A0A418Y552_9BURK|nr:hypothetical protein [Massilia cavernae]RJG21394.1 hypothetical protein D3872_06800 [Massilia cavernae]